ncbi:MAG: class I SAM-dependent methyltransferase [Bacteroidales bacterium]|nr:class I SAM-dependent methyltransferase [Bacteroidales bacterium]
MAKGEKESGIVIGNFYDKYKSNNYIARKLMEGFEQSLFEFVSQTQKKSIYDVGCGEGYWVLQWNKKGILARGCDFSEKVIDIAKQNAIEVKENPEIFEVRSIYDLETQNIDAELISCCEVLEHLEYPEVALKVLQRVVKEYLIVSVPREPLWRLLNLFRGKYLTRFGNTPGHIQMWSKKSFICLVSKYFDIVEVKSPLPWTMLLCRKKI